MSLNLTGACNDCVRYLVRTLLGMPDGSVRPANMSFPAGAQSSAYATVLIMTDEDLGFPDAVRSTATGVNGQPDIANLLESSSEIHEFVASIQFFRDGAVDAQGLTSYGDSAFDRAARLAQLLQTTAGWDIQDRIGIALVAKGPARNASIEVDGQMESRGIIELTFRVENIETVTLAAMASASFGIQVQQPGGRIDTQTLEVPL
jgi:hypothetical protein